MRALDFIAKPADPRALRHPGWNVQTARTEEVIGHIVWSPRCRQYVWQQSALHTYLTKEQLYEIAEELRSATTIETACVVGHDGPGLQPPD